MTHAMLPVVLLALPLAVAVALWLARPRATVARIVGLALGVALLATSGSQLVAAAAGERLVHAVGGWAPPFGIVLVVDRLGAMLVLLVATLYTAVVAALGPRSHGPQVVRRAVPLLSILVCGLNGAFMTGDLFNLFVMFELVLLGSYLLLQVPGTNRSLRVAFPNVVVNLLASLLFFTGVGVLYGLVGSVNLADLATRLPTVDPTIRLAVLSMLVVAFGTKAALLPLAFWLPGSYPAPAAPIAAFFAGIMTKLGAYSLLRIAPLLATTALPQVLVWVGAASALLGVLAALSQFELRRLLAFHSVSQMGYIVAAMGLSSRGAVAGALYFLVHHALVKTSLYLVADVLERRHAERDLRRMPVARLGAGAMLGGLFFASAVTLAGLPPSSGFVAKVAVFVAGARAGAWVPLGALVLASLFTLASMLKIWQYAFSPTPKSLPANGQAKEPLSGTPHPTAPVSLGSLAPVGALVTLTGLLALAAGPSLAFANAAAAQLLDTGGYIDDVRAAAGHGADREGVWR